MGLRKRGLSKNNRSDIFPDSHIKLLTFASRHINITPMKEKNPVNLIAAGENQTVVFKANFNDSVIESLVAFTNTNGGKVLLGVADNGNITGIITGKESIQQMLNEIKHKTEYKVLPDVEIIEIDKKTIVILSINEYPSKPISFKGRYFKRINNSNHIMSTDEVVNEYLKVRNRSWDMFPADNFTLEDLDLEKVNQLIQKINSKREHKIDDDPLLFLKKYGLIQDIKITNAALLLFSQKPQDITEIQIGLFESDTVIKKSVTIKENLLREVELVMDFIMSHIHKEYIIANRPEREERWQYPLPALREFVINAIIHRDYRNGIHSQFKIFRDKIELWNSGKLPEELTIEDLYKGNEKSLPRNIKIADIFKEAFLIEKYGSGIKRAVKEINDYHLPLPAIAEIAGGLNVTIYANSDTTKDTIKDTTKDTIKDTINDPLFSGAKETLIFQKIKEKPTVTADELAKILNINLRNTKKYLSSLKEQGKLQRQGSNKSGFWQVL